jgi:hypothetical protein
MSDTLPPNGAADSPKDGQRPWDAVLRQAPLQRSWIEEVCDYFHRNGYQPAEFPGLLSYRLRRGVFSEEAIRKRSVERGEDSGDCSTARSGILVSPDWQVNAATAEGPSPLP